MDSRPFPPPRGREPDTRWAESVLDIWADRGFPELDGVPVDQLKLARALLGLTEPWQGDLPPDLREP